MIRDSGRIRQGSAVFGLMVAAMAVAPELTAQQRWGGANRGDGAWGRSGNLTVEQVIRLADELELTEAQREELESVRVELLDARTSRAVRQMVMLSEVRAGIREPEAIRAGAGEAARETREMLGGVRERLSGILTEDQREELRRLNRRAALREWGARDGRGGARLDRMRDRRGRGGGGARPEVMEEWRGMMERWRESMGRGRGPGGQPASRGSAGG